MELRQLRLFLAAAEEGSITAAARRMNLTQPGLSRQIKALEEELGVELFTRGAHSVALDPEPEAVCVSAGLAAGREIPPVVGVFVAELRRVADEGGGR
jgi:DNA-binding transcriptional LysR family regulator